MTIKGLRVYVIIAAVILTLGTLLTLQFIYQKYNVEQPLFKLYSQTKLVKGVKIEDKGNPVRIIVNMKKTDNLQQAYLDLKGYTKQVMGNHEFVIELRDQRTKSLEDTYYKSQFIIYEAKTKGDFTRMAEVIDNHAREAGAQSRIFIDDENIYIQFTKDDNYLYEIISRKSDLVGNIADRMGSGQV
ncbi:MAG: hypothetical protein CVU89_07205 [Firmicutes bacterium HGW-Firmicutes-14]|nr:MAG: hypothetical protein CVU89_07205 [Firmicutes bacterium HGW-Firmicutes-14]